jgi:hypothetical protein
MTDMARGIDRNAALAIVLLALTAAVVAAPTATAGVSPTPAVPAAGSRPAPTSRPPARSGTPSGRTVDRSAGSGAVAPSGESGDVASLLLLLLAGFLALIVIPTQLAKGIARRRARDAVPPTPLRRSDRGR